MGKSVMLLLFELSSETGHNNYVIEEVRSKYVGLVDLEWGRYS